ncbi:hypothetical protein H4O09_10110 [Stenotrophomonas sp. W1S232]|uniref:Uncharacterized protein n=1 Tax=Stenotrophomonas koreensis TaxID=266128 RepID=A0A7W3V0Z4_9GAMM|nr:MULTISPECIES: hypothetical protein [Xanthomonadaceae]MBB1117401.1 hypothetical protein [Stenotrophomonas koreensis]MBB1473984.1 hypothetical protein [Luteimonas sp. MC1782]
MIVASGVNGRLGPVDMNLHWNIDVAEGARADRGFSDRKHSLKRLFSPNGTKVIVATFIHKNELEVISKDVERTREFHPSA